MPREFISVSQAAKLLGCSAVTIRRYLESGQLEGFQRTHEGWWMVLRLSVERKQFKEDSPNSQERVMVHTNGRRGYSTRHYCV